MTAANAEAIERTTDSVQNAGVPTAEAEIGTHGEELYDHRRRIA